MELKDVESLLGIEDISISRVKCATVGLDAVKKVYITSNTGTTALTKAYNLTKTAKR